MMFSKDYCNHQAGEVAEERGEGIGEGAATVFVGKVKRGIYFVAPHPTWEKAHDQSWTILFQIGPRTRAVEPRN